MLHRLFYTGYIYTGCSHRLLLHRLSISNIGCNNICYTHIGCIDAAQAVLHRLHIHSLFTVSGVVGGAPHIQVVHQDSDP